MKRCLLFLITILSLFCLSSCNTGKKGVFFSDDALSSYGLTSDFPNFIATDSFLENDVFYINIDLITFRKYSKLVYDYLNKGNYYYVGTYEQQGIVAELMPNYVYTKIYENYDWNQTTHKIIYSTNEDLNNSSGRDILKPSYEILISRDENAKYNTSIKIHELSAGVCVLVNQDFTD